MWERMPKLVGTEGTHVGVAVREGAVGAGETAVFPPVPGETGFTISLDYSRP